MNNTPIILIRWLKDRTSIRITKDYLDTWYNTPGNPTGNMETTYQKIMTDYLNTDMQLTSEPVINDSFGANETDTFPEGLLRESGGVVLQIQDTMDIKNSSFSQLNMLNNATPIRQTYVEGDEGNCPRGMLRWVLTDGFKQIHAAELETISDLDLKTPFGAKILVKNCRVRRGMLLLKRDNIKVLGGKVESLYGGNMVAELKDRLKQRLGLTEEGTAANNTSPPQTTPSTSPSSAQNRNNTAYPTPTNETNATANGDDDIEDFGDSDLNYEDLVGNDVRRSIDYDPMYDQLDDALGPDPFDEESLDYAALDSLEINNNTVEDSSTKQSTTHSIEVASYISGDDDDFVDPPSITSPNRPSTSITLSKKRTTASMSSQRPSLSKSGSSNKRKLKLFNETDSPVVADVSPMEDVVIEREKPLTTYEKIAKQDAIFVEVDHHGSPYCTFDYMYQVITAMVKEDYSQSVDDVYRTKAKCVKLGKFRMASNLSLYLEVVIGDPKVKYERDASGGFKGTLKAIISSELIYRLIGKTKSDFRTLIEEGGHAGIAKSFLKPFQKKVTSTFAYLTLDVSILEKEHSASIEAYSLMPLIVDYEPCPDE